jgi:alpha-D-ribose 1-methylphosphonate 5-triphosphate synthase subunit PhnG
MDAPEAAPKTDERRFWMGVLAKTPPAALEAAWQGLADKPGYRQLRAPQIGLAMVRGRIGGTGEPFNLGEMTMTRAAVQLVSAGGPGPVGYGHVAGRNPRQAELAALLDALLQDPARKGAVLREVIEPLAASLAGAAEARRQRVEPSKVEFFTMVRGA